MSEKHYKRINKILIEYGLKPICNETKLKKNIQEYIANAGSSFVLTYFLETMLEHTGEWENGSGFQVQNFKRLKSKLGYKNTPKEFDWIAQNLFLRYGEAFGFVWRIDIDEDRIFKNGLSEPELFRFLKSYLSEEETKEKEVKAIFDYEKIKKEITSELFSRLYNFKRNFGPNEQFNTLKNELENAFESIYRIELSGK